MALAASNPSTMTPDTLSKQVQRMLYHHRTQGKAVEGVHIRGITDAMRAEGVAVDIISLPGADPYTTPKAMSPTSQATWMMKLVSRFPEPLFELAEVGYNLVAGWRLFAYFKAHRDVGFVYERYALFMFVTVLLARLKGLPVILEVNDSAAVDRVRPLFFRRLALLIERWVFRHADGLVFVSTVFRDRMIQSHGQIAPTIIAPNAANISQFSFTPEQRVEARQKWGLDGHVVCGYLGAFVPWHAIDEFVFRMADYLHKAPHLKLLLVGDGACFDALKAFVQERGLSQQVILTGRVPHDQVPGLLAAMDMAVLPSAGDYTSPVKLFEFMACAVPPIAPDFLPIQEVLREGETGWMFKAGDLDAAVQAVLLHSQNAESLKQTGQAARQYIASGRQWRDNVVQLVCFWQQLRSPRG
jgi:glycosyltransferase involved in cell wall biosynthesis